MWQLRDIQETKSAADYPNIPNEFGGHRQCPPQINGARMRGSTG
jgi:hypothetical protein